MPTDSPFYFKTLEGLKARTFLKRKKLKMILSLFLKNVVLGKVKKCCQLKKSEI
jgi:hypothetical protein